MANDPFRLRVMKAVCAALKGITPANGYAADMSDFTDKHGEAAERVFRGRTQFGDNDPLPMLSVLEDPQAFDPSAVDTQGGKSGNRFRILIQGFVEDDKDHPLDPTYHLSAQVIEALVKSKKNKFDILGMGDRTPCILSLTVGQPVHRPPDDEVSNVAFFLIGVTLTLAENLETPYS